MAKGARCRIHQLTKVDGIVWTCAHCPYVLSINQSHFLLHKVTYCFKCGDRFNVTREAIDAKQLLCETCLLTPEQRRRNELFAQIANGEINLDEELAKMEAEETNSVVERIKELNGK